MRVLLILLAFGVLIGAGYGVREYAPQYLPDQFTSDGVLTQRMRARIMEDERAAAFFTKFEQLFPADHNELMAQFVALYRRGGTEEEAFRLGESYMTSFIEDNQHHVSTAEPAVLVELATALTEGTRVLRRENPTVCGATFGQGRGFTVSTDGMSDETQNAFIRISNAMLEGIASGKRSPTEYVAPTEAQWMAWLDRYVALGGDRAILEASANEVMLRTMPPEDVCAMVETTWTAALQAEDDFVPRFVSHSLRQQ